MSGPQAIAPEVCGAILVGGASRRMGRPKAFVEYAGRSFAARVADALRAELPEVVAVGRGALPRDLGAIERLDDAAGIAGPLAGILALLRQRPRSAWLVAACDLPLLDPAAVRWLLGQRGTASLAILPRLEPSRVEPLLALYEPAASSLLEPLAARGERSLQGLALEPGVSIPTPPAALAAAWRNVNTEEELRLLEAPAQPTRRRKPS